MKGTKYWRLFLFTAPLAGINSVFVMLWQCQPKRVNIKFITTWASRVESQLFWFCESFQEGDLSIDLLWLEPIKLDTFFGCIFDSCLLQCVAHWVFTAFAKDFGDLENRSTFLQIQTLDLFDLCTGEARLFAHLLSRFGLILSGRWSLPWRLANKRSGSQSSMIHWSRFKPQHRCGSYGCCFRLIGTALNPWLGDGVVGGSTPPSIGPCMVIGRWVLAIFPTPTQHAQPGSSFEGEESDQRFSPAAHEPTITDRLRAVVTGSIKPWNKHQPMNLSVDSASSIAQFLRISIVSICQ